MIVPHRLYIERQSFTTEEGALLARYIEGSRDPVYKLLPDERLVHVLTP